MKKLFVIRHIRYFYLKNKLTKHVLNSGYLFASKDDVNFLKNVWEGKE